LRKNYENLKKNAKIWMEILFRDGEVWQMLFHVKISFVCSISPITMKVILYKNVGINIVVEFNACENFMVDLHLGRPFKISANAVVFHLRLFKF
jgi:hypothetical protein